MHSKRKNHPHQVALVTGGNRGIGFAVCRLLAKRGIEVILTSRDPTQGLESARKLIDEKLPIHYHPIDITDTESIASSFRFVEEKFGKLDILINNAGIAIDLVNDPENDLEPSLLHMDLDIIRKSIETNTLGAIQMIQTYFPLLERSTAARIVNVSSRMGQLSSMKQGWPGYRISKAGLNAATRILAAEFEGTPILINAAHPGWVKSEIGGPNAIRSPEEGADTIVWLATLPQGGPSGQFFRDRKPMEW